MQMIMSCRELLNLVEKLLGDIRCVVVNHAVYCCLFAFLFHFLVRAILSSRRKWAILRKTEQKINCSRALSAFTYNCNWLPKLRFLLAFVFVVFMKIEDGNCSVLFTISAAAQPTMNRPSNDEAISLHIFIIITSLFIDLWIVVESYTAQVHTTHIYVRVCGLDVSISVLRATLCLLPENVDFHGWRTNDMKWKK